MIETIRNIFSIQELKRRVLFTLGMLFVFCVGRHVPTPGINSKILADYMQAQAGGILGMVDLFTGGAFGQLSIFALGIMPYISSSIIMQLLTAVIPALEKLSKEGDVGRKKITQYTRYGTVLLCVIQSSGVAAWIQSLSKAKCPGLVMTTGGMFTMMAMLSLTTGTMFLMWMGEQMTERGVGNGISMLIFAGIVTRFPSLTQKTLNMVLIGEMSVFTLIFLAVLIIALTAFVVFLQAGHRKIPIQYSQRIVGRKVYGGASTYLPLKVDHSGVIAIIFASSLLMFPGTITKVFSEWLGQSLVLEKLAEWLSPGAFLHIFLYVVLIIFFCYFYTAIIIQPLNVAENLKKYGGFIPGVRPGRPTAEAIDYILTRITLVGAFAVALVAVVPDFLVTQSHLRYFGGTTVLIVVGVALDTMKQIESHLLMRHYEGFMKHGKIKSRTTF